ncbi:MAG: hypothetical protein PUE80_08685 [bacterium]|nr:hypothetical protein [bacterium]
MQKYEKNAENKNENFAGFEGWWGLWDLWDGGFGWMEENKKSGGGDVRAKALS